MKKEMIRRSLLGFPIGIACGYVLTIIVSLSMLNGDYYACMPGLLDITGSEIYGVLLQAILFGIIGIGIGNALLIWEKDAFNPLWEIIIYSAIFIAIIVSLGSLLSWLDILRYFGLWLILLMALGIRQYFVAKNDVKKLNAYINGNMHNTSKKEFSNGVKIGLLLEIIGAVWMIGCLLFHALIPDYVMYIFIIGLIITVVSSLIDRRNKL